LIELLEEQKLEIIRRAVIRGVTTDVRRRPSGSEWIGDVPVHWNVLRSKYLFREVDQRSTTGEELRLSMSQKLGLVSSSLIEERRLVSESHVGAKICEPGDLVLNRLKAHLGVFALASERGLVSPDYTIFRPRTRLNGRYFEALYKTPACRVELRRRAKGIVEGFWRLYTDDFYDIRVPVPPLSEQTEIVASIRRDVAPTETAIIRTYRELSLLQEYRDRLIADVATGKLDVREAATKLPDEISQEELNLHELEPLFDDDLEDSDSCLDAALEEVEA
jgi:type I restriction enzyme S subunit